jgi:hypothetical protein
VCRITALALLAILIEGVAASDPPALPPRTRLLIGISCQRIAEAPLVRKDGEPWRVVSSQPRQGLEFLGINPAKVEHIWIACGDDYPKGSMILVEGDFDTNKLQSKWLQHVRDRRHSAMSQRVEERMCFSYELPASTLAVPGLPTTIVVAAAGPKSIVMGFDKDSVTTSLTKDQAPETQANLIASFPKQAPLGAVLLPPSILTSPQALLAGIKQVAFTLHLDENFSSRLEFIPENSDTLRAFADSAKAGIEQIRRVFPPLAKQQGIDPAVIRLVTLVVETAKVETNNQRIVIRAEISGEEFRKATSKP